MLSVLKPAPQWSPVSQQWRAALPRVQQDKALFSYRRIGIFTDWFNCFYQGEVSGAGRKRELRREREREKEEKQREGWKEEKNRICVTCRMFIKKTFKEQKLQIHWRKLGAWNRTMANCNLLYFFKLRNFNFTIIETSLFLNCPPPSVSWVAAHLCESLWSEWAVTGGTVLRLKRSKTLMRCAWRMPFTLLNLHCVLEL